MKIKNKSFLDPVQIAHMEDLHQHCTKGEKIFDYPIPSPSGQVPVEEENKESIEFTVPESAILI
ncbi:MAG: hypothetical protein F6K58_17425 [Symploca sp. SIO2E9]|nr:hypothetical protein [Symploca sp. SIO2E9]